MGQSIAKSRLAPWRQTAEELEKKDRRNRIIIAAEAAIEDIRGAISASSIGDKDVSILSEARSAKPRKQ